MKKLDLVKLINEKPYIENNLHINMYGIVISENVNTIAVLFFNPQNIGNYAIVNVNKQDLILDKEQLPDEIQRELSMNIDKILKKAKNILEPAKVNEYDLVELMVDEERYTKFGIHKGDRGCVMDNKAVQDYIEVDFSGIDKNGNFYGDCISVRIDDLKVIK